ncbi:MAG: histidinol-phosphatase [Candidatus Brocadia sp.]|nr:hypothetical protein [Candidatus Brocadia fulgida]MCC6325451.1 histidinol-phosphatase [Candidatus Brocadia sp.]MCE7912346.1 histidinol-phosphatase [Candidatus Brocadia sp. AMX3]MDG5996647.1 histidinol-phosphatase [Candidatus Brocadia sp.]RIJ98106.1 MAG: histidinol-phosphatase [Candidatus Brocadia sp.]
MTNDSKTYEIFKSGSAWIRADFHLHTKADKEFKYDGKENEFVNAYVQQLRDAGISIGAITNHNKFDLGEFKALRTKAHKEEIFLLPGIELSVKDGSNGLHTLVIFSDEWVINQENTDYINSFLSVAFAGQSNYENENARTNHDLLETIRELDKFSKEYFLIFAHVEADNGLWGGFSGGRIQELGENDLFKQRTLAFQKIITHDVPGRVCRTKVQKWLGSWYPAEVEGSDCKAIDQIGQGKPIYLKVGSFTFEAVKYALRDFQNRVSQEVKTYKHSYIRSISFMGGVLNGKTVHLSPELNTFIGIRGSGKSSILEATRYVLDIHIDQKDPDKKYKESLVAHTLGSGGKAIIHAVDRHGQEYEIRRILNEYPDVYVRGGSHTGIKIRETILHKPIYFGQKDLSRSGEGFEKDLVEKLVGEKLVDIRRRIEEQKQRVHEVVDHFQKLANVDEQKKEYEGRKQDAEFRLKIFKDHRVEEKLQRQVDFEADSRKIGQIVKFIEGYLAALTEFISRFEDDFNNLKIYKSNQNAVFFEVFFAIYEKLIVAFKGLKQSLESGKLALSELKNKANEFDALKKGLKEEFADVERKLAEELRMSGAQSVRPDDFLKLRKTVDQAKQMLELLEKQQTQKTTVRNELARELSALNELWHEEFRAIQAELGKINVNQPALTIRSDYKGEKEAFVIFMKDIFKGSRIRENVFQLLADTFSDYGGMYRDFAKVETILGSSSETFKLYFNENLKGLLTWQVPNKYTINYHDKELKHHSLGQRASALILFVLSQKENDVIVIDQPEDDLDNQTIYEDVIKLIRRMKCGTQFIFATHNANLPVLGDAEQIHACRYSDESIQLKTGSIDNQDLQNEIINIMEGGEEAFHRRKEIYQLWNPQSF